MVYTPLSAAISGSLVNAAWMNLYLRDNLNALNGNGKVPVSSIVWWPDGAASRPATYFECNGTFGVSDLRDKFIVGAGNSYAVGASAGALTAAQGDHNAHVVTATAHPAHGITAATTHASAGTFNGGGLTTMIGTGSHSSGASGTSAHTSQALTGAHAHTGSPFSILPLFTALSPILKGSAATAFPTPRTWADGDVPTGAMFNADLRDAFNALRDLLLYQNSIILWSGSLSALPSGYQLCDGTNGTPDLRERFVVQAGATYSALGVGGAASLALPDHGTHSATQADAHSGHSAINLGAHSTTGINPGAGALESNDLAAHQVTITGSHGSHSGFGASAHAAHASVTLQPPYIALGYICLIAPGTFTTPRTWADGELVDASRMNTYLRDNEAALYNGQVPIGGILIWHGSVASIPANYALCNGSGGTVDTRDRFPMGAGTTATGTTGGATSATPAAHSDHALNLPSVHSAHGLTQATDHSSVGITASGSSVGSFTFPMSHDFAIAGGAGGFIEHVHTVAGSGGIASEWSVDAHSAHSAMDLLPPYFALPYMQRIS